MNFEWRVRGASRADHALVVFSDIEMGAGGPTDDFPASDWLAELLRTYRHPPWDRLPLTVVFNGDTFDFLKTPVDGRWSHLVDEGLALEKLRRVIEAHPAFFDVLHRTLRAPGPERDVVFTVGNHDFELLFPAVQAAIRDAIGGDEDNVRFPGFAYDVGEVHVEHGSQSDPLFRMDPAAPFLGYGGRQVLDLPWASVALIEVAMPLHPVLYPCDRARPLGAVLERLPEVRTMLLDRYWQYWTRDWLSAWWSASDPTKRVSWTMFRQVAWRLQSGDASVQLDPALRPGEPAHRLEITGHLHEPRWSTDGGRRRLQTGCIRDEFELLPDGRIGELLPKVYAEVLLAGGRVLRSQLVEVLGDRERAAAMPDHLDAVLDAVRRLREDQEADAAAQARQLEDERR